MKRKIKFFKEFLKNPREVGAISPSSKNLTSAMLRDIDFKKDSIFVEYGPGNGVFTKEIINKKSSNSILIIIELNKDMFNELKNKFESKNIFIYNESVENIQNILKRKNIKKVDYIISGIPFSSIEKNIVENILNNTKKCMHEKSLFITFQYTKVKLKIFLKYFSEIKL
jgi:phospholipid N-methyltransferase